MGPEAKLNLIPPGTLQSTRGILLFGFLMLFMVSSPLSWAQGVTLTMSPLSFDLELLPGSKEELVCTLFNDSPKEVRLQAFVAETVEERNGTYRPAGDGENPSPQASCVSWIRLEEASFVLPPRGGKQIRATLTVPPSARPGFYTAMMVFKTVQEVEEAPPQGSAATLKSKIDVLLGNVVFVRVRRRGVSQRWSGKFGVIEAFAVERTEEGFRFSATLANRGRDVIEGKGKLVVTNALGKRVIDAPLGGGRGRVIPGFSLDFVTLYGGDLPPGDYAALAVIDYGGVHKAEARTIFHVVGKEVARMKEEKDPGLFITDPVFLSVNKEILEGKITPGAHRTFTLALYNESPHPVVVRSQVENPTRGGTEDASSWVTVSPEEVSIEPYKTKTVRIMVQGPASIPEGNRYVRVDFLPQSAGGRPVPANLQKAFGASALLILENLKGTAVPQADLRGVEVLFEEFQPKTYRPKIVVHFVNTGNTHLQPSCVVTFSSVLEERTAGEGAIAVKPGESFTLVSRESPDLILPGEEGMLVLESQRALPFGKYTMVLSLQNGGKEILRREETLEFSPRK